MSRLALAVLLLSACSREAPRSTSSSKAQALWQPVAAMPDARQRHTATLLPSGKVLIAGGFSSAALSSALLYDPVTNVWTGGGTMSASRSSHGAQLLPNGRVLVAGGAELSAELYDPGTNGWTAAGATAFTHAGGASVRLLDGGVLVLGGADAGAVVEQYSLASNSWSLAAPMLQERVAFAATVLPSGLVLVSGGEGPLGTLASSELYDPAANSWADAGTMAVARSAHTSTLLFNGMVLIVGGPSAELYVPATNSWTSAGLPAVPRASHTSTALVGGRVLVVGGAALASAELYDPASGQWADAGAPASARSHHSATLLTDGLVLLAGGAASTTAELFEPTQPPGGSCTSNAQCDVGLLCVNNVCCDGPCAGPCDACDLAGLRGKCSLRAAGALGMPSCNPTVCNGAAAVCPSACATNAHCVSTHYCSGSTCRPRQPIGAACFEGGTCASGNCTDDVCCDQPCGGGCEQCNLGGMKGFCTVRSVGFGGSPSCAPFLCAGEGACPVSCTTGSQCAVDGFCRAGACNSKKPLGGACTETLECASGTCVDGVCCDKPCTDGCDSCASGTCTRRPVTLGCPALCTGDNDCVASFFCSDNRCVERPAPGASCTSPSQCPGGNCVDGVCCNRTCDGSCESCGTDGKCTFHAEGSAGDPSCSPYLCAGGQSKCRGICSADAHCASPNFCSGGFCTTNPIVPPPVKSGCGCNAAGSPAALLALLLLLSGKASRCRCTSRRSGSPRAGERSR